MPASTWRYVPLGLHPTQHPWPQLGSQQRFCRRWLVSLRSPSGVGAAPVAPAEGPVAAGAAERRRRAARLRLGAAAVGLADGAAAASDEDAVGVVIVDHGSRRAESNKMLDEFAELYKEVTGRVIVEVAHMEIAEPTIAQALERCAARGARSIIIAPYFLSRGRHIQQDIPALVAQAAEALPAGVSCTIANPIGVDALMAQLIENRVRAAEARQRTAS